MSPGPAGDGDVIRVRYYAAASGPTMRIDMRSDSHVERVRAQFELLRRGPATDVSISSGGLWELAGLRELLMATDPRAVPGARAIEIEGTRETRIDWRMTRGGWERCVDLLEGLSGPGHQYLTEERKGFVLVVLALGESRR